MTIVENKRPLSKKLGTFFKYFVLTIFSLVTISPVFLLIVNSFKSQSEIITNPIAMPNTLDFGYILSAIDQINFISSILLTFAITSVSLILILIASSLASWMMVRNKTKSSGLLFLAFTSAMLIPFQAVMYPLLSMFEMAGLKNIVGLVIMYGGFGMSMSVFLFHGFLKSVPQEIEEAAVIDGSGPIRMFGTIIFPLLKSTTVTVIILNAMWIWNDYLLPFLVIGNSPGTKTLTLELYFAKLTSGQYGNPWELIFPAVFVTIIPILILFLLLQKYIVKGVTDGAVKG